MVNQSVFDSPAALNRHTQACVRVCVCVCVEQIRVAVIFRLRLAALQLVTSGATF